MDEVSEQLLNDEIAQRIVELSRITNIKERETELGNIKALIAIRDELYPKGEEKVSLIYKVLTNPAFWGMVSNVGIGLLITKFEVMGVVTSRAMSLIKRT